MNTATTSNFRAAFNGLLLQAQAHGLDTSDERVRAFLVHVAEVDAQQHQTLREAETRAQLRAV